jgi:hypothetical protein
MRDVLNAISAAAAKISWSRFVISLVFCLILTAIKLADDWSAMARDVTAVVAFVGAAFLIECIHNWHLDRRAARAPTASQTPTRAASRTRHSQRGPEDRHSPRRTRSNPAGLPQKGAAGR